MLNRYLQTRYGMTPADYRRRWGLADDYPMVAPAYAAQRSALASSSGSAARLSRRLRPKLRLSHRQPPNRRGGGLQVAGRPHEVSA